MKYIMVRESALLLLLLLFTISGLADEKSGEEINWQVISSGGNNNAASTNYNMSGTTGQTAVGAGISDNYGLSHGFWQEFAGDVVAVICGDVNESKTINILDITYLISYLYKDGPAPVPHECTGDPNGSSVVNLLDITYLIAYLYKDGPSPVDYCCDPVW